MIDDPPVGVRAAFRVSAGSAERLPGRGFGFHGLGLAFEQVEVAQVVRFGWLQAPTWASPRAGARVPASSPKWPKAFN